MFDGKLKSALQSVETDLFHMDALWLLHLRPLNIGYVLTE